MNLRIADAGGLVAFLHRVIVGSGRPLFHQGELEVVAIDGRVFFHRADPVTVGGPYRSVEALVRSEGIRRYALDGDPSAEEPAAEVFEWESGFFRVEGDGGGIVRQYADLETAVRGVGGVALDGS
ncbi:MAG: hypothetical protein P8170_17445 [Gemmatimonadota bacterium]